MSLLVLLLPPRSRLGALGVTDGGDNATAPGEFDFVLSLDGQSVAQTGRAAPALLPRAERTVLLLADADVAWHRIDIPKAPPAKLRAALAGAMEERLLEDEEALQFALAPGAAAGGNGWVAVTHRGWLASALAALESVGREVEQVVPASRPRDVGREGGRDAAREGTVGHFLAAHADAPPQLVLERKDGVACLALDGALARALLPSAGEAVRYTAAPAAAAAAERWLGVPVTVLGDAERALAASRSPVNLRQFELAPRHRGLRALRQGWRRFGSRDWRVVRWGLVGLLLVQVLGLNAYAWQQQRLLADKRQSMDDLLRATFPGVKSVLDAPLQMQRETERVRAQAGRVGDSDLEALLGATAAAWPDGAGASSTLRCEGGKLTLAASGWSEPQVRQFRERLLGAGYTADFAEGRVTVSRTRGGP